jgi:radical SAM protein with 4Fe4S-binding SPASM domain
VYENLHRLHARVVRGRFAHPVVVSRVLQGDPHGVTPAQQRASDRDIGFHRSVLAHWPRFESVLIKRDAWLGYVAASDPRIPDTPCGRWFELSITAEGKVVQCCMDGKGQYIYGDVTKDSLLDIYNRPTYRFFRESTSRKRSGSPCSGCSY